MRRNILKKALLILIAGIILFSIPAQAITPEEIEADIHYMRELLEEVHPNIYHTTSKEVVEPFQRDLIAQLYGKDEYTLLEAYQKLASLAALFRDGHTQVFFPQDKWNDYLATGGTIFPLRVELEDEVLTLKNILTEEKLPEGSQLLAINGILAERIKNDMLAVLSYESKVFGARLMSNNFSRLLWALFDIEGPFAIKYRTPGDREETVTLQGLQEDQLPARTAEQPYKLDFISAETALLVINSVPVEMNEDYFNFLEESFKEIKEQEINHLLIDMRNNGGGSTYQFNEVFHYLSDTPYRSFSRVDTRYSRPVLARHQPWHSQIYYRFLNLIRGDDIYKSEPGLTHPPENDYRFSGQTYLLVGPATFSAAADFAALCQDYEAARIVGQETGGLPTSYGDSFFFELPNTSLQGRSSYKYFVRPGGQETSSGVIPDQEIDINKDYPEILATIKSK